MDFEAIIKICLQLYSEQCPGSYKHRNNISLSKVSDQSLLVLLILQTELGIKSSSSFLSDMPTLSLWVSP